MTEEKLIKKEIFSYTIFIAIIALICIFKNEIWEFVKFIFSNLDFICGNFANFVSEDNIIFFSSYNSFNSIYYSYLCCLGII